MSRYQGSACRFIWPANLTCRCWPDVRPTSRLLLTSTYCKLTFFVGSYAIGTWDKIMGGQQVQVVAINNDLSHASYSPLTWLRIKWSGPSINENLLINSRRDIASHGGLSNSQSSFRYVIVGTSLRVFHQNNKNHLLLLVGRIHSSLPTQLWHTLTQEYSKPR